MGACPPARDVVRREPRQLLHNDGHGHSNQSPRASVAPRGQTAFAALDGYGFGVRDSQVGHNRGATIVVTNDTVSIDITADWYERKLSISVKVPGSAWVPIERLLPDLQLVIRPLPCNAKRGALEARLNRSSQP
jgi:hypothetical protein